MKREEEKDQAGIETGEENRIRYFLVGPTGSGKSGIALEIADSLGTEILALDSMKVYRRVDIGTTTPTVEERGEIPYHMINIREPHQSFSVADYMHEALAKEEEVRERGKLPLFVGGTPMYLKRLIEGLFEGPDADWDLREQLKQEAEEKGRKHLHDRLKEVDPNRAEEIHPNDLRRVVRALEVYEKTGQPMSELLGQSREEANVFENRVVCLRWPREELYDRIEDRVDRMMESGWLEEAKQLHSLDPPPGRHLLQAVGYRELFRHLEGEISLEEAVERIKSEHRQLARQQLTWYRNFDHPLHVVNPAEFESKQSLSSHLISLYRNWPAEEDT